MTAKTQAEKMAEKVRRMDALAHPEQVQPAAAEVPATRIAFPPANKSVPMPPLAKPVRSTLDLPPAVHRDLQGWLMETAARMGKARLTKQEVLEALVRRLLIDETLTKKIMADLKSQ